MIFLCGIPSEPSLGLVQRELGAIGAPHVVFHQRRFAELAIEVLLRDGRVLGLMRLGSEGYDLEEFRAVYTRLMDYRLLPEIEPLPPEAPARIQCHNVHAALMQWCELAPGRVMNRSRDLVNSYSKPLQTQMIQRCGFATPSTVVTNDPETVWEFKRTHGRVIYKSASYVRSIVRLLEEDDMRRLFSIYTCPVQFQEYIEGENVRVHTIGDRCFGTRIQTPTVDYRYSHLEGEQEKLEAVELSDELEQRCLSLAATFGLEFAGIDLKVTAAGEVHCLEVNPSPAFSYYELHTGQRISRAVAEHLAAAD